MEKIFSISWSNTVLCSSFASIIVCCIVQAHVTQLTVPIHLLVCWAIFVVIVSTWFSCYVLRLMLKVNAPITIEPLNTYLTEWLKNFLNRVDESKNGQNIIFDNSQTTENHLCERQITEKINPEDDCNVDNLSTKSNGNQVLEAKNSIDIVNGQINLDELISNIESNFIQTWYKNVSDDTTFTTEAKHLLFNLTSKINNQLIHIDKMEFLRKVGNVVLLHLKEYRRALRRVERGTASTIEEAYRYAHPGSRSSGSLEHSLHRVVTVLAREFLQWELSSSLPCKLLFSILAKKLLGGIKTVSSPHWIFKGILKLICTTPKEIQEPIVKSEGIVSSALGEAIHSTTAAAIPRSLPKTGHTLNSPTNSKSEEQSALDSRGKRASLTLEGLDISHRGLWADLEISEVDSELDEEKLSPVYEEPTDFATTIARLRNLLHQKSAATTPLPIEEKSCTVYEGSHLAIPWTEFHTAPDGSQQLLYCIQFDDIEQHGSHLFETTTATVKRQYSDFVQLHASLEEVPSLSVFMSEINLPEGGRLEMENYLKQLCTRLAAEYPPQLRHFLRPSSSNKKADTVAPRLDRFLAKTVSGVFNTLKTVVPGFEIDPEIEVAPMPTLMPLSDVPWRFVENRKSNIVSELQQLVAERIDYCTVDTAYEAVDSVEGSGDSELLAHWWQTFSTPYDEELDELDSHLTLTQIVIDLACELLVGSGCNNAIEQEAVVRSIKLFAGNIIESFIETSIMKPIGHLGNIELLKTSENEDTEDLSELKEELLRQLMSAVPLHVKLFLGDSQLSSALKLLMNSFEHKKINEDLNLQMLDVFASQLLASSKIKTNHQSVTL